MTGAHTGLAAPRMGVVMGLSSRVGSLAWVVLSAAWASLAVGAAGGQTEVTGRVLNAVNGAPVVRALVNLNSRAVLTDSLGRFEFPAFVPNGTDGRGTNGAQAYVKVTKPGYSSALDAVEAMGQQPVADVTKPLELKIYPNALISGVVVGSDRQPIGKVQVTIYREMGDEASRRMMPVGTTQTDTHGEYRFDQGGGRYAVMVRYSPRTGETGEAVLPQRFPEESTTHASTSFVVNPGEERKIDLQVRTGPSFPVLFRADGDPEALRGVRMLVKASGGPAFTVFAQPTRVAGEFRIELPSGSYQMTAQSQTRERRMEAEGHVTVAGKAVTGLAMHFADLPSIPVQMAVDAASGAASSNSTGSASGSLTMPSPQSLNLYLRDLDDLADVGQGDVRVMTLPDKSFAFQPAAGRYRLTQLAGSWFVERATYGTTDLLTQTLTVTSGSGTDVLRVVVSDATGQVTGTVRKSGSAGTGFVYLIPHEASLTYLYTTRIAGDGTYQIKVPPGTYTIVAFEHRFPGDLRRPEVAGRLAGGAATTVAAGGKASLDLELQGVETVQ